ncbi:MAG: SDR family oxidoreductase [Clostridia bacterium]|nr:SDR family oxidoreductase [Clostridia bacterium]
MTVLITGASGGIGKAVARLFAQKGYNVAIGYNRGKDSAEALCRELCDSGYSAKAFCADVSDSSAVREMFKRINEAFGGVDVLVNNAGIAQQKLFTDITDEDFDRMFSVNVKGVFNCCREAIPYMVNRKNGRIINVSSVWGISGASCEVHYSASKAAVIGLTKALAKELGPSGICVNCVAPGVIDTPMNSCFDSDTMTSLKEETPLMKIGTPDDVAKAVMFFASEDSSFVTGQVLCTDGGFIV